MKRNEKENHCCTHGYNIKCIIFKMKKIILCLLVSSTLYAQENPYAGITTRNAFELTISEVKPILPPVAEILRPTVFLTGISRYGKIYTAHLALKGKLPSDNEFLSLRSGEKQHNIKMLKIKGDSVFISNNGSEQVLTFKNNGLPSIVLKSPSVRRSSYEKDEKRSRSSSKESKSKTPTLPTPKPQIVRVPSRKPQVDPRIIEKGLEYLSKTDNDEKKEHVLKRLESLQSGQSHIKSDIDRNERRRQYDEWKKRND
jgi:hypothetical protein